VDEAIAGLRMVMQPIYRSHDGDLLAHEALLRVENGVPTNADDLLDAALRSGRLWEVERTVRGLVARRMAARPLGSAVFVNLHPNSLLDPQLYNSADPLVRYAPSVVLEITERSSLGEVADLPVRLKALRSLGYRIAVDDMGSGYSGFNAFAIQPDFVKFDRALIQSARSAQAEYKLVSSIATICRDLGIATIAEGIEDEADLDAARSMGCSHVQGYLLARPAEAFRTGPYVPASPAAV
jgi:EAL domain-containing protein (putative c-di-GMP-specific phosphodiesterase class I)